MNLCIYQNYMTTTRGNTSMTNKLDMIVSTIIIIFFIFAITIFTPNAQADIYRFVTVDGVESFTDAPITKNAHIVIKDSTKASKHLKKNIKKQQTHDISLEEIVTKAVQSIQGDIIPGETSTTQQFEIRLPPVGGRITSPMGMRIDPIDGKWRMHNGIDIAIPTGTSVRPAAGGVIIYSGLRSGYGNTILMEHDNGIITLYGHNSKLLVSVGQRVDSDTPIALSGSTGRSTGPHLHFEAWQAGINVTSAFMPGTTEKLPTHLATATTAKNSFRKQILSDGTILFTNIP